MKGKVYALFSRGRMLKKTKDKQEIIEFRNTLPYLTKKKSVLAEREIAPDGTLLRYWRRVNV